MTDVTAQVNRAINESGVSEGACIAYVPHTTAGVTLNSALDANTGLDLMTEFDRLVPTRVDFHHQYDTPRDAAGHIKATLVGNSLALIVQDGELILGGSQSVLLCEFDGPRHRQLWLRIIAESG